MSIKSLLFYSISMKFEAITGDTQSDMEIITKTKKMAKKYKGQVHQ
jgi:hypothetical protein